VVISKVSLTRLLIPRAAVIQIKEEKPLASVFIPCVKGVSEKFNCIWNRYNIRTISKTEHSLYEFTDECIYSIPSDRGRSYNDETGRPLAVRLSEHRHNLKDGLLEKSKLAQHAYEEGHRVD
jgi:hypothetical protein